MSDVWLKFAERVSHTQRDNKLVALLNIGVLVFAVHWTYPQKDTCVCVLKRSDCLHIELLACIRVSTSYTPVALSEAP